MKTCTWCGKEYDEDEADLIFDDCRLSYWSLRIPLCGQCANEAVDNAVDGVFEECCEKCGTEFDPFLDSSKYDSAFSECNGVSFMDSWDFAGQVLCADCAIEAMEHLPRA